MSPKESGPHHEAFPSLPQISLPKGERGLLIVYMGFPWLSQTDLTTFIFGGWWGSSLHSQELRKLLKMTGLCFKNLGQQNEWIVLPDTPARHLKSLITL